MGARRNTLLAKSGLALAAMVLLATFAPPGPERPPAGPAVAALTAEPVVLNESNEGQRRVGGLTFIGGWALDSDDPRFGGISALHVEQGRAIALSDAGIVLRFTLPGTTGFGRVRLEPLRNVPGNPQRRGGRDSEAMAVGSADLTIAFENRNQLFRYARDDLRLLGRAAPALLKGWAGNAGAEALVTLPDGRRLLLSEGRSAGPALSDGVLFFGDPADPRTRATPMRYRRPPGYRVTDAALLPDGRLLFVNRRFHWWDGVSVKITTAPVASVRPGAAIAPREIAHLEAPLTVDNLEAASVTQEGGRTVLWLASDDNFNGFQRTLLLKFAVD